MTDTRNAAAMAFFRLVGAGVEFRVHRRGIDLAMPPDFPPDLADEAAAHADAIGALLRLRVGDEPRQQKECS